MNPKNHNAGAFIISSCFFTVKNIFRMFALHMAVINDSRRSG